MGYYRRDSTIFDSLTLNPLPYPVLLFLAVASIFLVTSWYFSYESVVESAEEQLSWVLLAIPVVLLLVVRWLSSMENPDMFFATSSYDYWRRRSYHRPPPEGSSPWGVAALIVLLLILVQYQPVFRDSWLV